MRHAPIEMNKAILLFLYLPCIAWDIFSQEHVISRARTGPISNVRRLLRPLNHVQKGDRKRCSTIGVPIGFQCTDTNL